MALMARNPSTSLATALKWTCRQCRLQLQPSGRTAFRPAIFQKSFSTTSASGDEVQIRAAPEIDLQQPASDPARILPASASYFTAAPRFNDHVLLLQRLVKKHESVPLVPTDKVPRMFFMTLLQYRSSIGEKVASSKYAKILELLRRLNMIHPKLRSPAVWKILELFRRPGTAALKPPNPVYIDEYGRAKGVGRRKESSARVYLVEGTGEVLVNGKSLSQAFPRVHDRESALWALTVTERMDKYNVFALVEGGGVTGQAESITLALAKALLVHEPALKPALRKAGCVTRIMKRVERKKPGRLKARKKPTWVKR